jgi:ParB family chromosome partitioning protein
MLTIQAANRQGVTVRLHAGSGADIDELIEALRSMLAHLETSRGLSLK